MWLEGVMIEIVVLIMATMSRGSSSGGVSSSLGRRRCFAYACLRVQVQVDGGPRVGLNGTSLGELEPLLAPVVTKEWQGGETCAVMAESADRDRSSGLKEELIILGSPDSRQRFRLA